MQLLYLYDDMIYETTSSADRYSKAEENKFYEGDDHSTQQ